MKNENTIRRWIGQTWYQLVIFSILLVACQKLSSLLDEGILVTGITLNKTESTLTVGGTEQLIGTIAPQDATDKKVNWSSAQPSIATVSSSGLVTGVAEGVTSIVATTNDGGYQATCRITVTSGSPPAGGDIVATPTFSLVGGTYGSSQTLTISCATPGATIRFTTDGSDPRNSSTAVEGNTVLVSMPMTIKAYARKSNYADSSIATSAPFTITSGIVFVSTSGNDSNQGTRDHPKQTIQAGIDLADSLFATGEVRVAEGTYEINAQMDLKQGISLYGSYSSDFSSQDLSYCITFIYDNRTSGDCISVSGANISSSTVIDGFTIQGASTSSGSAVCINLSSSSPIIRNNTLIRGTASTHSFGIGLSASSPLIYNTISYGGNAGQVNSAIFMNNGSSPKLYNNTLIVGIGSVARWVITLRDDGADCHPSLKNNLLLDLTSDAGGTPGLYHMNSGSGHYPYCYTTNLFYVAPVATGDGAYVYYGSNSPDNININNYTSQIVYTSASGYQLLTYNDPAWRNLVDVNPLFVNASGNDYHLQPTSPARNAGTDLSSEIPALDRDGNPRTSPWSIGAYEQD